MSFTFLMCSERSGSNLITRMMNNHSKYCGPSPVHLFRIFLENRARYGDLEELKNWERLLQDVESVFNTKTGVWKTSMPEMNGIKRSMTTIIEKIYRCEALAHQKDNIFLKENHLYRYLSYFYTSFPGSKIVFLVRDPRDMALSWKLSPVLRGSVIRATKTWKMDQERGLEIYHWLSEFNLVHLLKYEKLVNDAESELRMLCDFLNIDFEYNMLEFSSNEQTTANAQRATDWRNLEKPVMKKNFNKYRNGLSEDEIKYVESVCRFEMDQLGYESEYDEKLKPEDYESKILHLERHEKPEYLDLPQHEREIRAARHEVLKNIKSRPLPDIHTKDHEKSVDLQV